MAGLIAGADTRVRNAFRATLRDEPSTASLISTAELAPCDVLEVEDLTQAIARAEEVIRERASRPRLSTPGAPSTARDIFDALVTDDCIGPAVHAPYVPTPVPPRATPTPPPALAPLPTPVPPPLTPVPPAALARDRAFTIPPPPNDAPSEVHVPPAAPTLPMHLLDAGAQHGVAGEVWGAADVAFERARPSIWARLRERKVLWASLAFVILVPLTLLSVFAVGVGIGRARAAREAALTTLTAPRPLEQPAVPAASVPQSTAAAQPTTAPTLQTDPAAEVPVLDVKSLKTAPPPSRAKAAKKRR